MGINPQMTQILKLADKDFKVAVVTRLSKEKVSGHFYSLLLERIGYAIRHTSTCPPKTECELTRLIKGRKVV